MMSHTGENPSEFRYRIYVKGELMATTTLLSVANGIVRSFQENREYRGFWMTVVDIHQGRKVIMQEEGGSRQADIVLLQK